MLLDRNFKCACWLWFEMFPFLLNLRQLRVNGWGEEWGEGEISFSSPRFAQIQFSRLLFWPDIIPIPTLFVLDSFKRACLLKILNAPSPIIEVIEGQKWVEGKGIIPFLSPNLGSFQPICALISVLFRLCCLLFPVPVTRSSFSEWKKKDKYGFYLSLQASDNCPILVKQEHWV